MYNATVYVLGKPVFWLPYLVIPLNWNIPFQATAGYKSQYGAYIELSKGITFNQYLSGKWHADWREQRGFGGGWDQDYDFGKYAKGDVKLYWTQDKRAPTPGATNDAGQLDPWANRQDRDRGRITWRHRTDINENTNIIMRYHRVADEYFLQDFFEREYRAEQEPHSFVTATHNTERYGAMVHVTKRMNSFEGIVERLPEGRLDWKNQPFFTEKVYNVSRVQVDNLNLLQSRSSSSAKAVRADGYSTFIAPVKFKDVNFTPLLGYRGTEYSRDAFGNNSHFRQILEYGADLRTHAYRVMDVSFDKMGIEVNQLRHIFEPSVALKGQAASMTSINKVTHFDNIDTLDSSSEVVFGIDNRLQTKRVLHGKSQRVDLVSLNTYVHYAFINPDTTTSGGGGFKLVENELTLRPYDWLQFQSRLEVDLSSNYIKLCNNDIVVRRGRWRFLFGQRYVHDQYDYLQAMSIPEAQQFVTDGQYKVNDLWSVGGYIRWDTANGNLQEWQLSASRDLHDFILDFGYNTRNSLIDNSNKSLFFTFRMKAMPQFNLGGGGGIAAFSEPRIGETVAGANENWGRYSTSREQQFWGFPQ
jgi:lipopolysaccharide assembly outer membrane protein LptD (OstA)